MTIKYEVIVGNVGTVYSGHESTARKEFNAWAKIAKGKTGRAAGEDVTLVNSEGDILREYVGRLTRAAIREVA